MVCAAFYFRLVLPMMQSYANAGDFTVAGKMKSALIENAIFYGSYLAIFVVCLIYLAARPDINLDGLVFIFSVKNSC